jgi:CBS domain-containing protein
LQAALSLMPMHRFRRLPVVDKDSHVVGVITETDIVRAFIELYRAGHAGLYLTLRAPDRVG